MNDEEKIRQSVLEEYERPRRSREIVPEFDPLAAYKERSYRTEPASLDPEVL